MLRSISRTTHSQSKVSTHQHHAVHRSKEATLSARSLNTRVFYDKRVSSFNTKNNTTSRPNTTHKLSGSNYRSASPFSSILNRDHQPIRGTQPQHKSRLFSTPYSELRNLTLSLFVNCVTSKRSFAFGKEPIPNEPPEERPPKIPLPEDPEERKRVHRERTLPILRKGKARRPEKVAPPPRYGITPEIFLKKIGKDCIKYLEHFKTWEDIFTMKSATMKKKGIPVKQRKWILNWTEKYRQGIEPYNIPIKSKSKKYKVIRAERKKKHEELLAKAKERKKAEREALRKQRIELKESMKPKNPFWERLANQEAKILNKLAKREQQKQQARLQREKLVQQKREEGASTSSNESTVVEQKEAQKVKESQEKKATAKKEATSEAKEETVKEEKDKKAEKEKKEEKEKKAKSAKAADKEPKEKKSKEKNEKSTAAKDTKEKESKEKKAEKEKKSKDKK